MRSSEAYAPARAGYCVEGITHYGSFFRVYKNLRASVAAPDVVTASETCIDLVNALFAAHRWLEDE